MATSDTYLSLRFVMPHRAFGKIHTGRGSPSSWERCPWCLNQKVGARSSSDSYPGPKECIGAGLSSLWHQAPVLVISDPAEIDKQLLDSFTVNNNMRRDVALASYWIDRINSFRTS